MNNARHISKNFADIDLLQIQRGEKNEKVADFPPLANVITLTSLHFALYDELLVDKAISWQIIHRLYAFIKTNPFFRRKRSYRDVIMLTLLM